MYSSDLQCNSVQCSAVQCSAVQCSAVQCSAVQCSAEQCSAVDVTLACLPVCVTWSQLSCHRGQRKEWLDCNIVGW